MLGQCRAVAGYRMVNLTIDYWQVVGVMLGLSEN
jgi:hypothetical protein